MKYLKVAIICGLAVILLLSAWFAFAEQPQQPPKKNHEAIVAQDARRYCENNLAEVLKQFDELQSQNATLQKKVLEQNEELKKLKPEVNPEVKKDKPK